MWLNESNYPMKNLERKNIERKNIERKKSIKIK